MKAIHAGDGSKSVKKPGEVYLATERLTKLFAGVDGVLLVNDAYACLRGEDIRELLEACGATRSLHSVPVECHLSWGERTEIRRTQGLERSKWERQIDDNTLRGLDALLSLLPSVGPAERLRRSALLWEALADVESRRGPRTFEVEYTWGYSHETKTATFDAAFVKQLQEREWVPDADGNLLAPELVVFDTLGWKPNSFLLSKIRFKPPIVDQLAMEMGFEPGVLDLLKKHGITSVADLVERLGVEEEPTSHNRANPAAVDDALKRLLGDTSSATPPVPDPAGADPMPAGGGSRTPGSAGGRPFISYVGTHLSGEDSDPDDLEQAARMALEAKAIKFILSVEPGWQRAPTHNPGFDLYKSGPDEQPTQWCEVKAMTGSLTDRPVGVSRTQFDCARAHSSAYWLYVVERAGTDRARILRIQDPAGNARTFTFDHGWLDIAELHSEEEHRED